MKYLLLCSLLFLSSCEPHAGNIISEKLAIAQLNKFFEQIDVDSFADINWSEIVTQDFRVFEAGKEMDLEGFIKFATPSADLLETNWAISDPVVTLDTNTAHISYFNDGFFRHGNQEVKIKWMESVLMVLEDDSLKLKFLNSNLLERDVINMIEESS